MDQVIYGCQQPKAEGLLKLIDQQHTSDSCRTYQCIKTLVSAANKSSLVKDKLLQDPGKWQWAVNWLKEKMDEENNEKQGAAATSLISTAANDPHLGFDSASNEDSLSRNFQRTTSAVVTLAEANAILAEFDLPMEETSSMDVESSSKRLDCEDEDMPDLLEMKD